MKCIGKCCCNLPETGFASCTSSRIAAFMQCAANTGSVKIWCCVVNRCGSNFGQYWRHGAEPTCSSSPARTARAGLHHLLQPYLQLQRRDRHRKLFCAPTHPPPPPPPPPRHHRRRRRHHHLLLLLRRRHRRHDHGVAEPCILCHLCRQGLYPLLPRLDALCCRDVCPVLLRRVPCIALCHLFEGHVPCVFLCCPCVAGSCSGRSSSMIFCI